MRLKKEINRGNLLEKFDSLGFEVNENSYYERSKVEDGIKFGLQLFGNQYALKIHVKKEKIRFSAYIGAMWAKIEAFELNIKQHT